jgi:hypothetical protein
MRRLFLCEVQTAFKLSQVLPRIVIREVNTPEFT